MAICPTCKNEIEDDIGVVTCSVCGAQVLLDFSVEASSAGGDLAERAAEIFVDEMQSESLPEQDKISLPDDSNMQDVVDYANSTASQGQDGMLRFNLKISGIDTADLRKHVAEVLSDKQFLWEANDIINTTHNGQLNIRDLTAVKAALLVHRLRSIQVEITWEQYAIHQ